VNEAGIVLNTANVLGVLSLIFWTLLLVIGVKYMMFVLRADNKGEGGILSLMALTMRSMSLEGERKRHKRFFFLVVGVFGAALLYGDGLKDYTAAIEILKLLDEQKPSKSLKEKASALKHVYEYELSKTKSDSKPQ
jgi:KUP system potassium uptake protein